MGFFGSKIEVEGLKRRISELEARLEEEIRSNRTREDALVDKLMLAMGTKTMPYRENSDTVSKSDVPEPEEELNVNEERLIVQRAREFQLQARDLGQDFEIEVYIDAIKANPEEYLNN
jgi:hypothetical protein